MEESHSKINKTRIRIEKKILSTQKKLKKSDSTKNSSPKIDSASVPMLVKQNSEPLFEDSTLSDADSSESFTMFDSDDERRSSGTKHTKVRSMGNIF